MEGFKYFKLHKEEYDFFSFKNKTNAFQAVTAQHVFMALED